MPRCGEWEGPPARSRRPLVRALRAPRCPRCCSAGSSPTSPCTPPSLPAPRPPAGGCFLRFSGASLCRKTHSPQQIKKVSSHTAPGTPECASIVAVATAVPGLRPKRAAAAGVSSPALVPGGASWPWLKPRNNTTHTTIPTRVNNRLKRRRCHHLTCVCVLCCVLCAVRCALCAVRCALCAATACGRLFTASRGASSEPNSGRTPSRNSSVG